VLMARRYMSGVTAKWSQRSPERLSGHLHVQTAAMSQQQFKGRGRVSASGAVLKAFVSSRLLTTHYLLLVGSRLLPALHSLLTNAALLRFPRSAFIVPRSARACEIGERGAVEKPCSYRPVASSGRWNNS
jgi:hypothetical protein